MKARWFRTCGMLLACASLSFAACGDDSDSDAGVPGGSGGAGGTTAGTTGGTTAGSGGAKAGSGAAGGGAPVVCGGTTCTVNSTLKLINAAAMACCTSDMKCGQANTAGKCLASPGVKVVPDTSCPAVPITITVGGAMMSLMQAGCCLPNGQCGNDYAMVGWGCVARPDIGTDMGMGGPFMALACGGSNDGGADAGL